MPKRLPTFVDVFAGCGGLSLGLSQSGMKGLFAVEQNEQAFATFKQNFLTTDARFPFRWPKWLPREAMSVGAVLKKHGAELLALRGKVDVLAGGPPCQGFSTAGRRRVDDPRNQLFREYVKLVKLIRPRIVLIENVKGFTMDFQAGENVSNYAHELISLLSQDYNVHERLIDLSTLGVPQQRVRYFLVAVLPGVTGSDPFETLKDMLPTFLRKSGIRVPVSSWCAISNLEVGRGGKKASAESPGFEEIVPSKPLTAFQAFIHDGSKAVTDLRLARHSPEIEARFADIIAKCHSEGRLNSSIGKDLRVLFGLKKQALRVLDPDRPSPTITSMPDDLIHFREPRTLTVRENARLQTFPDWFSFHGKYTTGGLRRRTEVPRFTQVANAVPPLAAKLLGLAILECLKKKKTLSRPYAIKISNRASQKTSAEAQARAS
jgi:DNA (cytosine-5)-methyltransferase 1